jgi:hypothetical protein
MAFLKSSLVTSLTHSPASVNCHFAVTPSGYRHISNGTPSADVVLLLDMTGPGRCTVLSFVHLVEIFQRGLFNWICLHREHIYCLQ